MSKVDKSAAINKIKAQQQQQQQQAAANKGTATNAAASAATAASSASSSRVGARVVPLSTGRIRWAMDLTESRAPPSSLLVSGSSSSSSKEDLVPFGFSQPSFNSNADAGAVEEKSARDEAKHADLIYKSAMALAQAPGKQLLMTCFMLWMSGNSLQIFSIMMLSMALWTPISEMAQVSARFARFDDSGVDMTIPKITFVAIHLAGLAMGLYKCNTMGLLPTSTADWIDTTLRAPVQVSGGGII